jgi:hypothetical protein
MFKNINREYLLKEKINEHEIAKTKKYQGF